MNLKVFLVKFYCSLWQEITGNVDNNSFDLKSTVSFWFQCQGIIEYPSMQPWIESTLVSLYLINTLHVPALIKNEFNELNTSLIRILPLASYVNYVMWTVQHQISLHIGAVRSDDYCLLISQCNLILQISRHCSSQNAQMQHFLYMGLYSWRRVNLLELYQDYIATVYVISAWEYNAELCLNN